MTRLLVLLATLAALLAAAVPAALAQQQGPDAGQNEFFFHDPEPTGTFDGAVPQEPEPDVQQASPLANEDLPENPLAAAWTERELDGGEGEVISPDAVNGKEAVFRWFWSSANAGAVLIGAEASVTLFAIPEPADGDPRVIGRATVRLVVGAQPTLNESIVPVTGTIADGERLSIQVVPTFIDTGQALVAVYDSSDFPSGFSFRDPPPPSEEAPAGTDGLASAPAQGLEFSATLPADPQRDESEPNIEIDGDGAIYTCGPTGVGNGADYAQVSLDGGNQFHLMGEPPRGQQAFGGGGDCGLATSPERNPDTERFNFAYTGLGPLTNFATAASDDNGRTMRSSPSSQSIPGVDRQWNTFLDEDSVLLSYNQQAPRQVVVQRSDDGGVNYGPPRAATSTNPSFPGPMHSLPAALNPEGADEGRVPYFSWNRDNQIFLAISTDEGDTWHNCRIAEAPGEPALFTTSDHDDAGNIYIAYSENDTFHTFMHVLAIEDLGSCLVNGTEVAPNSGQQSESTEVQADVGPAIQMDRDRVRTSLFSWVAAGGAPGRVAVTFYGSETDGDPNVGPGEDEQGNPTGFRGSWDVYVSQSLDALEGAGADVAQVKATTHPFHYDSICLNGLGCSVTGGDRSLADFFAMDFNPQRHGLHVVYNQGYKRPDDAAGDVATPAVISQIGGPTLDGEPLDAVQGAVLDTGKADGSGDALADFSHLCLQVDCPEKPTAHENEPGADLLGASIGPEASGGITVTMRVADLSEEALDKALADQRASSLLFVFRWINGFRSSAAVAKYTPGEGFRFGFNDYVTGSVSCGGTGSKCLTYPGDQPVEGSADAADGRITIQVPRDKLRALSGSTGPNERPSEVQAGEGSRLYDGVAFTLAVVPPPDQPEQSFLYPFDNAPSFDFLVPGPAAGGSAGGGTPAAGTASSAAPAGSSGSAAPRPQAPSCVVDDGFRSVGAARSRRGVRLGFARLRRAPVDVDVFQTSVGRRVIGERLVARFRDRNGSLTWNGRANRPGRRVTDGYYFVRYRLGDDVRRITLRRVRGRFAARPAFYRRASCGVLRSFKLERPVFGGRSNRALGIAFRVARAADVRVEVLRGSRVVRRYARRVRADTTHRLRFDSEGRRRGDYRVRVRVLGTPGVTAVLTSRRL